MHFLLVPGIDGSGDAHWQSHWEADFFLDADRIHPSSWSTPDEADWLSAIDRKWTPGVVFVAHSLGCLAVAKWMAANPGANVSGAFLVAPPDPRQATYPEEAGSFELGRV